MAYFKVSGSIYETFGFPLDKKIYDYFAKNKIELSDYLSNLYKRDDAPDVPEEYEFLKADENGRGVLYSIWDSFLCAFDGGATLELYNDEDEVIWETILDLRQLGYDDIQCQEDKQFLENIKNYLPKDKCLITGEITQYSSERIIYLDEDEFEDFDPENLVLNYFVTENRVLLSSITYNDTVYDEWTDGNSGYGVDKEYYSWVCPAELGVDEKTALNDIIAWAEYNDIDEDVIPRKPATLKNLKKIEGYCSFSLPSSINVLKNLSELKLYGDTIFKIPNNIVELPNLEILLVEETPLIYVPNTLAKASKLKELVLDAEEKLIFEEETNFPSELEVLWIHGFRKIDNMPIYFSNLTYLKNLTISSDGLEKLPESIGNASSLTKLTVMGSEINALPHSIANLSKLEELEIDCENLTHLPDGMEKLPNLEKITDSYGSLDIDSLPEKLQGLIS